MNVLKKLNTALRGGVRGVAETIVDANAIRIFDQEISDSEAAIHKAKLDLAKVIAEKLKLQREAVSVGEWIERKELQAANAIRLGKEGLARDVAEVIADKEQILNDQMEKCQQLETYELGVKRSLSSLARKVKSYRRELCMFQATANAQKASETLAGKQYSITAGLADMEASVRRISAIQNEVSVGLEAMDQVDASLSDRDLDSRIIELGISTTKAPADVVFDRILGKLGKER